MTEDGPPLDDVPEEDLVEALMGQFHAQELREWMSANELKRERGANKRRSAELAVAQDPEGIARFLYGRGAIDVEWDRQCIYYDACGNTTATAREEVCDACLDVSRRNSSEGAVDIDDYDDRAEYMAELHARFGDD